jgi:hypothetical protein
VTARRFFVEILPSEALPPGEEFAAELRIVSQVWHDTPTIFLPYTAQDRPGEEEVAAAPPGPR